MVSASKPCDGERMRIMRVNDFEPLLMQNFFEAEEGLKPRKTPRESMHGEFFRRSALREQGIGAGEKLRVVAQAALAAHGQQNLVLAAAPVRTRVEVEDFHPALAYTILPVGAIARNGKTPPKIQNDALSG